MYSISIADLFSISFSMSFTEISRFSISLSFVTGISVPVGHPGVKLNPPFEMHDYGPAYSSVL